MQQASTFPRISRPQPLQPSPNARATMVDRPKRARVGLKSLDVGWNLLQAVEEALEMRGITSVSGTIQFS